ncbi:hypothetical protein BDV93DRAFT_523947 [Ceratobasidium sp. AG-I]|nr:hypothetical protein BDV93DRAFT_523947 [Ceratobasidium sp. AG-I]
MGFSLGSVFGKVEVAVGSLLNKESLKESGLAKQKAALSKKTAPAPKASGTVPPPGPTHEHASPEEQLAAEGAPGETVLAGGGGRQAI